MPIYIEHIGIKRYLFQDKHPATILVCKKVCYVYLCFRRLQHFYQLGVMMKYIVVILDGSSGWPHPALENKTSLESALTPILTNMAKGGRMGLAHTVPPHLEASSSVACTSILGFDPDKNFVGRAAIEASAMGIPMGEDEVVLRMNTVTIRNGLMESYAGGHITTPESNDIVNRLAESLDDERCSLHPGLAYRHILKIKGLPGLIDLEYTPPHDMTGKSSALGVPRLAPQDGRTFTTTRKEQEEALDFLSTLMIRAHDLLELDPTSIARNERGDLPVTDIWPFWPGVQPSNLPQFEETYQIKASLSSGVDLLFGLAGLFGLTSLKIEGVTDCSDNDYVAQARSSLDSLKDHDLVVIHIESPDEMGHAGDVEAKVAAIEEIDRKVMTQVFSYLKQHPDSRVLAMPDHPTPLEIKTHVNEPVPFLIFGKGISPNGGFDFTEKSAESTGLVYERGHELMADFLAD